MKQKYIIGTFYRSAKNVEPFLFNNYMKCMVFEIKKSYPDHILFFEGDINLSHPSFSSLSERVDPGSSEFVELMMLENLQLLNCHGKPTFRRKNKDIN